uniref:Glypican 5 n=1 Tax=Phasianus colchicus TaxID=9054 RepID=A0A669Q7H8_PHACC
IEQLLQASSAMLKFLISHNAAAFQETFEMLIKLSENYTSTLFCNAYRSMAAEAATRVQDGLQSPFPAGSEINTAGHLHFSKDCSRALLRMQYCPHCQGLILGKPCMGYCLNVIRGCLAYMAEVDLHWQHVLLNFYSFVNDALMQARVNGPELTEQVNKVCGPPVRKPTQSPHCSFDQNKYNQELKMFSKDSEETLASRRKEFISHLCLYRAFYGGLADQLCGNELAAADGLPCWNGEDVVKSYTHRVVGSGIKDQSGNPEIIDKLKRYSGKLLLSLYTLLPGKSFPKYDNWDLRQTGSGGSVEEQISGDCDDEDSCGGSGSEVKRVLKITECKSMIPFHTFKDQKCLTIIFSYGYYLISLVMEDQ